MKEQPRGLARTSARRFHAPAPIKNRDLSLVSVLGENHAGSGHPRSPSRRDRSRERNSARRRGGCYQRQQRHGWRREVTNARSARQHDRIEKPLIPRHKLTRYTYKSGPGATRTMAEIAR